MDKADSGQGSLVEQIMVEMFENIEGHEEFDEETIQNLKHLSQSGEIKRHSQVVAIVKVYVEGRHETA
jgi:hypothetical protein